MSVVADFSVSAEAFCLGEALAAVPGAAVELDRVVAHSPDHVMPFVWVIDTERETFVEAAAEDASVERVEVSDSFETAHLFQFFWTDTVSQRLQIILDHDGVMLEARGSGGQWRLWVRFGSREYFSAFQDHFNEFGEVTLHQLTSPRTPGGIQYGVSEKQREALLAAYDSGYYETPSTVTGKELADQLGVTQQAVSTRLRRGTGTLIENTLNRHRID
jgi:predicted DNA binding protein